MAFPALLRDGGSSPQGPWLEEGSPPPRSTLGGGCAVFSPWVTLGEDIVQLTIALLSPRDKELRSARDPMAWGDWDDLRNLLESCDLLPEWVPGVRPMDMEAG